MNMNIGLLTHQEIVKSKLIEKQKLVIGQIDEELKGLFIARMNNDFFRVHFKSDEEAAAAIEKLLSIKKTCINLDAFANLDLNVLDSFGIVYKEE